MSFVSSDEDRRLQVVALFGPTGSGKTSLACDIADELPAHLISCDALQVYRHLSAAVAKPEGREKRHPWALVDAVDPGDDFNAGRYAARASAEVAAAARQGRLPIVVGGTGLYLRALLKGLDDAPARDATLRARLQRLRAKHGPESLHRILRRLDPASAARLPAGDSQRVERALEIVLSGRTSGGRVEWDGPDRYRTMRIGLALPRDVLIERLDARVERFFANGLVDEVRELISGRGVAPGANSMRAIGYREVASWLATGRSVSSSEDAPRELVLKVQASTRRYAKRQMTWFRREAPTEWHDPREPGLARTLARAIARWWRA